MSLLEEIKRRNVLRIAGLYLVGAWLIVQVAGTVLPMFDAPAWLPRTIVIVLAIGFIPALIFAWAFELTPEGLKRETDVDRTESITPHTGKDARSHHHGGAGAGARLLRLRQVRAVAAARGVQQLSREAPPARQAAARRWWSPTARSRSRCCRSST